MMDELEPIFDSLHGQLNKDHGALRENLLRRLPEPAGPGGVGRGGATLESGGGLRFPLRLLKVACSGLFVSRPRGDDPGPLEDGKRFRLGRQ